MLLLLSVTDVTEPVASFQPTTTMFRLPADCAAVNGTVTDGTEVVGVAAFTWTKLMAAATAGGCTSPQAADRQATRTSLSTRARLASRSGMGNALAAKYFRGNPPGDDAR